MRTFKACTSYGLAFRVSDPPFFIAEFEYEHGQAGPGAAAVDRNQEGDFASARARAAASGSTLPGTINLGAWINTGAFPDQRFNTQGALLAVAGGAPLLRQGNDAVYGVVDQMLWRVPRAGDRSLNVFMRGMAAPGDRNLIDVYVDGGFTFKGPLERRNNDLAGIGFAVGRVSPAAAAFDSDLVTALGRPYPVRDYEAVVELTYQWKLAEKWFVQPDLQYIFHPGGNIPNPANPASLSVIPNALVLGTRMVMRF